MALKDPVSENQTNADNVQALKTILAQELLPEWLGDYQQVIALHMLELKKHVPSTYIDEFQDELDWLNDFIEAQYVQEHEQAHSQENQHEQEITLLTLSQGYKLVVKQKQLKDRPLPGFVCCELNTLGSQRTLFLRYKSLVLLSSIRVFLKTSGQERQK